MCMMRRRISYRVCRCTPCGVVTHLEARLLKDLVNRTIHPIRCASSSKQMFMKGMRIGDLCAETGHFWWALKVWRWTMQLMDAKDYDDWIEVRFDGDFGSSYCFLWAEKYDYYPLYLQMEWDEELKAYKAEQDTQLLFSEGQVDNLPSYSQNILYFFDVS